MRLTANQALERLQGNGLARRVKGESPSLSLSMTIHGRLYVFSGGGRTIIAPNDDRLPPQNYLVLDYANGKILHNS